MSLYCKPVSIAITAVLFALLLFSCTSDIEPPPYPPDEELGSSSDVGEHSSSSIVLEYSSSSPTQIILSSSSKQSSSSIVAGSSSSYGLTEPQFGSSSSQGIKSSSSLQGGTGQTKGNVFTDTRDGKEYGFEFATDGKIWMSENLNYSRDNTLGWCYGVDINGANPHRDSTTCDNGYGRLYEWSVAMDGNSLQGLCPNEWHIPSVAEWSGWVGSNKIQSAFYIYPGNYNLNTKYPVGWKERDESGFYWTSSGNSYFTGFWDRSLCKSTNPTCIVEAGTGALATDRFSIRCMADEDIKFSCGTNTYSPYTSFCAADNLVYPKCGGKEYNPETKSCCDGKEYDLATHECVNGALNRVNVNVDYMITCNDYRDISCRRTVILQASECVGVEVIDYKDQFDLFTVGFYCQPSAGYYSSSYQVSVDGTTKSFSGTSLITLKKIQVGYNDLGILCFVGGVPSIECRGPDR